MDHPSFLAVTTMMGKGYIGVIVGLAFLVVGVVGAGYYLYTEDWSLRDAAQVVKETSQDVAITAKVRTALSLSKRLSDLDVKVESRQGEVTLTGQVPSKQIKEAVGAIARDTSGVRQVHNNLTVRPSAAQPK